MTLEECYHALHGNYEEAKTRLMNDALVTRFIKKFPADPSMDLLRASLENQDVAEAFRAVHTLKGVAANLAFTELQQRASDLTEQLRDGKSQPDPVLVRNLEESYQLVLDTLNGFSS